MLPSGWSGTVLHVAVVLVVVGLGGWRAVRLARGGSALPAYVVASATAAVVSPVTWTHHLVPLVLAAVCMTGKTVRRTWVRRSVVVVVMTVNLGSLPMPVLQPVLVESRLLLALWLALAASYDPLRGGMEDVGHGRREVELRGELEDSSAEHVLAGYREVMLGRTVALCGCGEQSDPMPDADEARSVLLARHGARLPAEGERVWWSGPGGPHGESSPPWRSATR